MAAVSKPTTDYFVRLCEYCIITCAFFFSSFPGKSSSIIHSFVAATTRDDDVREEKTTRASCEHVSRPRRLPNDFLSRYTSPGDGVKRRVNDITTTARRRGRPVSRTAASARSSSTTAYRARRRRTSRPWFMAVRRVETALPRGSLSPRC